jgi:protein-L-isoaspartate(D-aspartate) O-methyltransferase
MTNYNEYKQQIIDFYDGRTEYDNDFTRHRALSLLELVPLHLGQTVLDVATGTGFIALAAAEKVGSQGKVMGVDFTPKMLQRARAKIDGAGLTNIELLEADVDELDFPDHSFDAIFCSSAINLFSDLTAVLQNWYRWLKYNGTLAFSCYSQESFFTPVIMKVCTGSGYKLPNLHETLGTEKKCQNILEGLGIRDIEVKTKQFGKYLSLDEAQNWWQGNWLHPQYHPLLKLTSEEREELKAQFRGEIAKLATEKGVWDESTLFLVTGHK